MREDRHVKGAVDEIRNPYSGEIVGAVPQASAADVEAALAAAVDGAAAMRRLSAHERQKLLERAAPLTALLLTRFLLDAGLPANAVQCITGSGAEVGMALCADERVRKISFTGSTAVGRRIAAVAGVKKLSLELGANCPVVVLPDADLEQTADAAVLGGYVNAGQVCISVQRVLVDRRVYGDFLDALVPRVDEIRVGDPSAEDTQLSALINEREAK